MENDKKESSKTVDENIKQMNILLVEDDRVNQLVSKSILNEAGHKVTIVDDGRKALKTLRKNDFDLILMDIQLPVVDGIAATKRIRAEGSGNIDNNIPILAMTAHVLEDDKERCLKAGMNEYIKKPVKIEELHKKINTLFSNKTADEGEK